MNHEWNIERKCDIMYMRSLFSSQNLFSSNLHIHIQSKRWQTGWQKSTLLAILVQHQYSTVLPGHQLTPLVDVTEETDSYLSFVRLNGHWFTALTKYYSCFFICSKLFLHIERIINNVQIFHNISTISKSAEEKKSKERICLLTENSLRKLVLLVIDSF